MKKKIKILIVDDSSYQRQGLKKLLDENGFQVFEAEDAIDGIQLFRKIKPDLVVMDVNMPIMEGTDAVRYIKKIDRDALVVMFSTLDDEKSVMDAIRAGARDFITKPLDAKLMLDTIERLLSNFPDGRKN